MEDSKNNFKVDFIGIGAAKCATTWVYKCLLEHPQVCGPLKKELQFFLKNKSLHNTQTNKKYFDEGIYGRGISFYGKYFKHCSANSLKGEFSVSYMSDPNSADLIKSHFPNVKIIVCLRDPIKRAYSHYWFSREFLEWEKNKTFEDAIRNKDSVYIDQGMYFKHLKRFCDKFPTENIGIFFVEDLKKNSVKFMRNIYKFLGVDEKFIAQSVNKKENVSKKIRVALIRKAINNIAPMSLFFKKIKIYFLIDILRKLGVEDLIFFINNKLNIKTFKKPEMKEKTQKELRNIFREDITNLEKLINRNLDIWK